MASDFTNLSSLPDLRYDFSSLSKGRLRAYNQMMDEFDRLHEVRELSDDDLELLSAAGDPNVGPRKTGQSRDGNNPYITRR